MKRIETQEDLTQWAKDVNRGLSIKDKCDYQDIYAHSNPDTIKKLFLGCNGDRKLVLCSVYNTMAYEECEKLMMTWAKSKAQEVIDEECKHYADEYTKKISALHDREMTVLQRESTLENGKRAIYRHLADMEKQIKILTRRNDILESSRDNHRNIANVFKEKARKFDTIKEALKE